MPVEISADTIVAVAPLESVIVTLLFEKSIPDSCMISSAASTEELSVPFKTILSNCISSSNNILSPSSKTNLVPKSSVLNLLPSSPVLPSSITTYALPADSFSRYLFMSKAKPSLCGIPPSTCSCSIINLPPDMFGPSVALPSVCPLSWTNKCVPLFLPVASSNSIPLSPVLSSAFKTILSSNPFTIFGLVKTSKELPIPEWFAQ